MSSIFPSATAVLVRNGQQGLEVLLLKRSAELNFAAGTWVFPGGRVDQDDYHGDFDDENAAARQAAVRETHEEAGLVIDKQNLLYFAHWVTPATHSKRFATWFFITEIKDNGDEVEVDNSEIVDYQWISPDQALKDHKDKSIELMAPTFVTLSELAKSPTVQQALTYFSEQQVNIIRPKVTKTANEIVMLYPGDQGYEDSDQLVEGTRNRLWITETGWHYEKSD
jgi:8-oxo-dGTP pyrophosphatase MutT (NUDIX family)